MDGRDQDEDGGWSTIEFENEGESMCTHKSTNRIWVELSYKKKVSKAFSFICKIEKGLYVCTLSWLEEWGVLFN